MLIITFNIPPSRLVGKKLFLNNLLISFHGKPLASSSSISKSKHLASWCSGSMSYLMGGGMR